MKKSYENVYNVYVVWFMSLEFLVKKKYNHKKWTGKRFLPAVQRLKWKYLKNS